MAGNYNKRRRADLYKIVVIGDVSVGKTSFMERYVNNKFSNTYKATIGADFLSKDVDRDGKKMVLQIWDASSGRERFQSISKYHYRGSDAFIVVYDITKESSFRNVIQWIKDIKTFSTADKNSTSKSAVILVGTKKDLIKDRVVSLEEAMEIAKEQMDGCHVCEISSKTGEGIAELMDLCCSTLAGINNHEEEGKFLIKNEEENKPVSYGPIIDWVISWFQ